MEVREILLTLGKVAIVDVEDFERVSLFVWGAYKSKGGRYFSRRSFYMPSRKRSTVLLHREVLGLVSGDGKTVEFLNGDGLDCRKSNLRIITSLAKRSEFRGVSWSKSKEKWRSEITMKGKRKFLGYHNDEVDAARAYDKAVLERFPNSTAVNFPGDVSGGVK